MVTIEYLCAALDEDCVGMQPMNVEGLVESLCGNMTIKNNAKDFVADYFDKAMSAVRVLKPDDSFRYSQYERTANLIIRKTARDLLMSCETMKEHNNSYHCWKKEDIDDLKEDLEYLDVPTEFQRAVDVKFESLENYAYRFLDYVLKGMEGQTVDLSNLALELPLVKVSDEHARGFLKSNFSECMRLLDTFRDSGFKVNYESPVEMIQQILYQKQKEILSENPYLVDLVEYDGVKTITLGSGDIEDLLDSLQQQKDNVKLSKFDELPKAPKNFSSSNTIGKILDLRKSVNRFEIIY